MREGTDLVQTYTAAASDRQFSDQECCELDREADDLIVAALEMKAFARAERRL